MTFTIISHDVYWDAESNLGGVVLGLANGRSVNIDTPDPEVLRMWCTILLLGKPYYYHKNGSSGIGSPWVHHKEANPVAVSRLKKLN